MTDVTTSEVEKLLPCPFCGASASEAPDDAVNCDNQECDASVYVVGRATWQRRAAIRQDKDRAGVAVATLTIEGCGPCAPDVSFSLILDPYDRANHGTRKLYTRPAQPAEVTDSMVERAAAAIANERVMRRGSPSIINVLDMLPQKLLDEVREDARAALTAALRLPDEQAGGGR